MDDDKKNIKATFPRGSGFSVGVERLNLMDLGVLEWPPNTPHLWYYE